MRRPKNKNLYVKMNLICRKIRCGNLQWQKINRLFCKGDKSLCSLCSGSVSSKTWETNVNDPNENKRLQVLSFSPATNVSWPMDYLSSSVSDGINHFFHFYGEKNPQIVTIWYSSLISPRYIWRCGSTACAGMLMYLRCAIINWNYNVCTN